jgi:hypothetical protein
MGLEDSVGILKIGTPGRFRLRTILERLKKTRRSVHRGNRAYRRGVKEMAINSLPDRAKTFYGKKSGHVPAFGR